MFVEPITSMIDDIGIRSISVWLSLSGLR